jgi:predicted oxidoreductase
VNPDWTTAAALERARACTPEAWIDAYLAPDPGRTRGYATACAGSDGGGAARLK